MAQLLQGQGQELGEYATRYPIAKRPMLHVLRDQAAAQPDKPWLVFDGPDGSPLRLAYGEAQARVNQVAHALIEAFGAPVHVGLFLRNQIEFFPALYGAMASRGVGVALNADSKGVLLQRVIEQAHLT